MELFTRVICHKNVIQSKIATMKKLALELFGNSYIGFEVCPYWKESDFSVVEAGQPGMRFALCAVCKFASEIAGNNGKVDVRTLNGEVVVGCYTSLPEMEMDPSLAFVECCVLDEDNF